MSLVRNNFLKRTEGGNRRHRGWRQVWGTDVRFFLFILVYQAAVILWVIYSHILTILNTSRITSDDLLHSSSFSKVWKWNIITSQVVLQKCGSYNLRSFPLEDISRCGPQRQMLTAKSSSGLSCDSLSRGTTRDDSWRKKTFEIVAKYPEIPPVPPAAILPHAAAPSSMWLCWLSPFPQSPATLTLPLDMGVVVFCLSLSCSLPQNFFDKCVWHTSSVTHTHNNI